MPSTRQDDSWLCKGAKRRGFPLARDLRWPGGPHFSGLDSSLGEALMNEVNDSNTTPELTLDQVRDSMLGYVAQGNAGHYQIGRLYNYVVTNDLAVKGGYESAQLFFSEHVKALSQSTLSLYGSVAKEFSEPVCVAYGMSKLSALLTYEKVTKVRLPEGDP